MNQTGNRTLVVVPTYNERENIAEIMARVLRSAPGVDVLVVDDNSPDGTGALASALASGHDRINVLPIGPDSRGGSSAATNDWSRWMPTVPISRSSSNLFSPRSTMQMWYWDPAGYPVEPS